jgi:hypothetical protein
MQSPRQFISSENLGQKNHNNEDEAGATVSKALGEVLTEHASRVCQK